MNPVVVTEIITHVRVWTVDACDVNDAVNRVRNRKALAAHGIKPVCVSNRKETRWAGADVKR